MRVLIDAVHPADVWVLGAVEARLVSAGADSLWISRAKKDLVIELIEARDRRHVVGSTAGTRAVSLAAELAIRDWRTWRAIRSFRPDVILTRSPAGVHAGRVTRTPVLYDTDDGHVAGPLFRVAAPFANLITSPSAIRRSYGPRHRRYQGYKELVYLHPTRFEADMSLRAGLGLSHDDRLFVLRLTAFTASHDTKEAGLNPAQVSRLVGRLGQSGRVVISSESPLPAELDVYRSPVDPHAFHHLLAAADLVVSDGQTVCSEAAVLGIPSIRFNSWAGRHPYQVELEERWGLTRAFSLHDEVGFFAEIERVLANPDAARAEHRKLRSVMLDWSRDPLVDLVEWTRELAGWGSWEESM